MAPDSSPEDVVDTKPVDTEVTAPVVETEKTPDVESESSTAAPKTMLEAVQAASAPKETPPVSETPEKTPAEVNPAEPTAADAEELSPEESKQLSAKTQRRLRYLSSQVKAKASELETLAPKAKELDDLNRYVREAGLSNNDVAGTLEIAAMLKHNKRGAYDRLIPIMNALRSDLGETLDPQLQERVKQNFISEEDARVIARTTAEAKLLRESNANLAAAGEQQRQAQQTNELVQGTIASATEWEATKAKGDPDWQLKRKDVAQRVKLAILEEASTKPDRQWFPNRTEIIKLNEDALKEVNDSYKRFTPRLTAITPDNGSASPRSVAEPKSMLDVVRMNAG